MFVTHFESGYHTSYTLVVLTNLLALKTSDLIIPDPEVEELLQHKQCCPVLASHEVMGLTLELAMAKAV